MPTSHCQLGSYLACESSPMISSSSSLDCAPSHGGLADSGWVVCLKWFTVYLLIEAESLMQAGSPRVRGRNHANWNLWITTFSSEAVPNSSSLNEDDVSWKIGDDDDQHVLILAHFLAAVITWAAAFLWHGNKYRQMHARPQTEAGSSNHLYKEKPNGFSGSLTPLFVIICLLNYLLKGE